MLGNTNILTKKSLRNLTLKYTNIIGQTMRFIIGHEDEEEQVEFKMTQMFKLISDKKLGFIIGGLGALLYGAVIPSTSLVLGKLTTAFALKEKSDMRHMVLKWALILLVVTFFGAICNYFKVLKLGELGSTVVSKTRKNLFKKYLELHIGFFDFESNDPSGLLSILSVDINNLKLFFTTIVGAILVTLGIIITALIIGFYYDWKLTLILFCFFPLRIVFSFLSGMFKFGGKRKYKEVRIEASSYFTECVTNTKIVFSFNFKKSPIEMYKSILDKETSDYIKDRLILSALLGAGDFLSYASNSAAYKCVMKFIRHKTLTFAAMNNVKKH
jgi:ABC-type multidrug transport system fused ATPase/permease subunit